MLLSITSPLVLTCKRLPSTFPTLVCHTQGPVLEAKGAPLGVVSAIAGQTRMWLSINGTQGHAGTVPMRGRGDALAAAAEVIQLIERRCGGGPHASASEQVSGLGVGGCGECLGEVRGSGVQAKAEFAVSVLSTALKAMRVRCPCKEGAMPWLLLQRLFS